MAILRGTQTSLVDVEVSNRDLYDAVLAAILERHEELGIIEFIQDGNRMVVDSINYHTQDETYKSGGPATQREKDFIHLREVLWDLLK